MRAHRYAIVGLIGLQFAFLVAAFADTWEAGYDASQHIPPHAFVFILSHMAALGLLLVLIGRAQRAERKEFGALRAQLERSARQAEDLIQCSSDLVWEIDATGTFTFVADYNEIGGGSKRISLGSRVQDLAEQDPLTPPNVWQRQVESNIRGEAFRDFRYCARRADDSIGHFTVNGVPIRGADGALIGFRGLTRECTREVELLDRMNRSLLTDPLTSLSNCRAMRKWLHEAGVIVPDHPSPDKAAFAPFAYLLVDLDGFKAVNDLYGHAAGDEMLVEVSERLRALLGGAGCCARIGGDEFAIALDGFDEARAMTIGQAIVDTMMEPVRLSNGELARFGASIGISFCGQAGMEAQKLFRAADQALYEVKHRGGGAVGVAEVGHHEGDVLAVPPERKLAMPSAALQGREEAALLRDLRGALPKGEFHLVFQPIVAADMSGTIAYEALLRWTHPEHGSVPPSRFVPLAEKSGLIAPIGAYVLKEACRHASQKAAADWAVTVNVSAFQFSQNDIAARVFETLGEIGLPPSRLILELTEQSLVTDQAEARTHMRALRAAGVRLALDDFGAGFANVSYLRDFTFDLVKIDRAILLLPSSQRADVLGALLQITKSFSTPAIVEGIETPEHLNLARSLGCSAMQGYLIGRPAREFVNMSAEWSLRLSEEAA